MKPTLRPHQNGESVQLESSISVNLSQVQNLEWQPSRRATPGVSFLDLPLEPQQMIYQYALQPQGLIHISSLGGQIYRVSNEDKATAHPCKLTRY